MCTGVSVRCHDGPKGLEDLLELLLLNSNAGVNDGDLKFSILILER